MINRKLLMGMVGGGPNAFIGAVHRMAATLDGRIELVCGAFSRTRNKSIEMGKKLFLPPERVYGSYREMFRNEAKLPEGKRMDFVTIATPNNMHYPIAMAALEAGFHVVCDKPLATSMEEALNLAKKVKSTKLLFCLTHNYTGYPLVKEARRIVTDGKIGKVRRVVVEYPQGWLATRIEAKGQKQALWRTDPKQAGISCCMGDIGTHCHNLAEYITGSEIVEVCADITTFVKGRLLDDDGSVLIRFKNGAHGVIWASQIAVGEENGLKIRVYGETGSLEWAQEEPNSLIVRWANKPMEILRTGTSFLSPAASINTRLPSGHPEGFIEAFANIYRNFALALTRRIQGIKIREEDYDYPNIHDGVRGMAFLSAVVKSSAARQWVNVSTEETN
jgi:predicted dehydrogenase